MRILKEASNNRRIVIAIIDILSIGLAYFFAGLLLKNFEVFKSYATIKTILNTVIVAIIVYQVFLNLFSIYNNMIRYENGKDYLIYIFICMTSCIVVSLISQIFNLNMVTVKTNFLACILISVMMISYRIVIRMIVTKIIFKINNIEESNSGKKNLLIIGAGASARDIIKTIDITMKNRYNIIGIIDDDKTKVSYNISGVRVLGDRSCIEKICVDFNVSEIFFTITKINPKDKKEILDICKNTKSKTRLLPSTESFIKNGNLVERLRDVEIADILSRDEVVLDNNNIAGIVADKIVLVTGAGGSIGSELCRQIMKFKPKKLVMLDIYENTLYNVELELKDKYGKEKIVAVIASVREESSLNNIFKKYKPNIVFHAAAHKHVPLMENSSLEAIKNNVLGTYNVVNCSDRYKVEKFVMISTDKAVNPTSVMGATKRVCEMIVQTTNKVSKTDYVAVRFGNVLGSNGSVVPIFKKQIEAGGPVTVTHKDITRFFMTIPEAVQLVLQALTYATGGEIFVLDMGEPVKIYDLAENMIKLSGYEPNVDIQIEIIGLRPGEKLYEELLMSEEGLIKTKHEKIFVAQPTDMNIEELEQKIERLKQCVKENKFEKEQVKEVLKEAVPTYIENVDV
ncbi:MAG: nucleoside-diphosphate sugar epimerase/dehydratase [Clostridia bacterium]